MVAGGTTSIDLRHFGATCPVCGKPVEEPVLRYTTTPHEVVVEGEHRVVVSVSVVGLRGENCDHRDIPVGPYDPMGLRASCK